MNPLDTLTERCPYCGELIELSVEIDPMTPILTYTEDCPVCCRPMIVKVLAVNGEVSFSLHREDD